MAIKQFITNQQYWSLNEKKFPDKFYITDRTYIFNNFTVFDWIYFCKKPVV